MQLTDIQPIADSLVDQLRSACLRIEIAGSVRRGKPDPKDLELVAIPATGHYTVQDLFETVIEEHAVNHLDDALMTLYDLGEWELDPVLRRNGTHYKRLSHVATGICCDLYITDARRWGIIATIRTGPGDFSKALVNYAHRKALFIQDGLLHQHAPEYDLRGDVKLCPAGERCRCIAETPEERDVFASLGLPWIEPIRRSANLLYASVPRGMWR